ncbi:MAG: His/Gly/Thr/Pro-type tRNA ligase C-terminal domain-containing protein, partial [Candidatus Lightella neohaematopini]|nr:His/Gly/Thr/Pro-type tRNA ligase C-terminal domain-containing protein [Candidatus Lightella neohaematopini]
VMPIIQPEYLWKKSGRLKINNLEIMSIIDRKQIKYILGPTNEEVILNLVHNEIHSCKDLPIIFYQIQYKFRDEIRPCFGVIRAREFIMKDAYSFHSNKFSLQKTYNEIFHLYEKIFNYMKINFFVIQADTGFIGGDISHEFYARKISNCSETKNNAIEIAHIFQLGTKYSHPMKAYIKKDNKTELIMGCYGIGITRLIAAIIEQNNDQYGIKWPPIIAPFNVALLPVNFYSSVEVKNKTEYIYKKLLYYNVDTLLYDRKEYFGVMLHDIELIGIPNILIISKSNLNKGIIEYKDRINNTITLVNSNNIIQFLLKKNII